MRAETQNHVDAIAKSLKLLGQRMDIETSGHRLEEFDAMIEAPDLWNDPAKAQKLMRERQGLAGRAGQLQADRPGLARQCRGTDRTGQDGGRRRDRRRGRGGAAGAEGHGGAEGAGGPAERRGRR